MAHIATCIESLFLLLMNNERFYRDRHHGSNFLAWCKNLYVKNANVEGFSKILGPFVQRFKFKSRVVLCWFRIPLHKNNSDSDTLSKVSISGLLMSETCFKTSIGQNKLTLRNINNYLLGRSVRIGPAQKP
jgi:hypothetical protein